MMSIKLKPRIVFLTSVILLVTLAKCTFAQDQDGSKKNAKAIEIFKSYLAITDTASSLKLLAQNKSIEVSDIEEALTFLERVTQIPSTAEYTYAGRFKVPREDYEKWKAWFKQNKDKLKWNKEEQKVDVQ